MTFRKVISGSLAAAMLCAILVSGASAEKTAENLPFTDISENGWYNEYVDFVYDNSIMKGVSDNRFAPDEPLTRAMFATILGRYAREKENEAAGEKFKDIEKNSWYSGYVGWAAEIGVVEGRSADEFDPDSPIKRAEIAAMLGRYIEYEKYKIDEKDGVPEKFGDAELIYGTYEYAAEHIETLRKAGVMDGKPGDGENPDFEPESNATRAEAAKLVTKLYELKNMPYEGYLPNSAEDGYAIYSASYLYWGGPVVQGALASEIDKTGKYPVLAAYPDGKADIRSYNEDTDTIGIGVRAADIDLNQTKFIKVCFEYADGSDAELKGIFNVNSPIYAETRYGGYHVYDEFNFTEGGSDEGYRTATFDLSGFMETYKEKLRDTDMPHILLKTAEGHDELNIRYIAFFSTAEDAEKFNSSEYEDYFRYYRLNSEFDYSRADEDTVDKYNEKITSRINEVLNSESEITPDMIEEEGGSCFYVSSIDPNASDDNDGRSPETPWRTLAKVMNESDFLGKVQPGDGVFFERGSEFYPEIYLNSCKAAFKGEYGITYAAYGEGAKPLFTSALDFREKNNGTGNWSEVDGNIYVLDEIDENPDFCGYYTDIGNIVFNGGEMTGVRIYPNDHYDPMGDGKTTQNRGLRSNGKEYFYADSRPCDKIESILKNDLEFFHNFKEGKLYLYCKDGNPSDRFDDIKVSTKSYTFTIEEETRIDNIAMCYSSWSLLDSGSADNVRITNCEVGFVTGGIDSVDSGAGSWGGIDNYYIANCYIHDVGDGGITNQYTEEGGVIQNVTYENNVIVACGFGIETWNKDVMLEDGTPLRNIKNVNAIGNIIAYSGYGICQTNNPLKGNFIDSGNGPGAIDSIFENNEFLFCRGRCFKALIANNNHNIGWTLKNNTYIVNPEMCDYIELNEVAHKKIDLNIHKSNKVKYPYDERYLAFYTSQGFGSGEKYMYLDTELPEGADSGIMYTNGYMISQGVYPPV